MSDNPSDGMNYKVGGIACILETVDDFKQMQINLLSCDAQRPDRRAIAKCIAEISSNIDGALSNELTAILLEGDPVEIEMEDKNTSSAFRALRKLGIDYEILE